NTSGVLERNGSAYASGTLGRHLDEKLGRRFREVLEERGAKPTFHLTFRPLVPISTVLLANANKPGLSTGERLRGEEEFEPIRRIRNRFGQDIDNAIRSAHEWLSRKTYLRVVKDPETLALIRGNGE